MALENEGGIIQRLNQLFREQGLNPAGFLNPSESNDTAYKNRIGYRPDKLPIGSDSLVPKPKASECVRSLEYDVESQQMVIHFNERGSYTYFDIPPWTFAEFNGASSLGTYFNLYIRNAGYEYERIA